MKVLPYILSGGSGTRLWPMSRSDYPKQLQTLLGNRTLLQEALSLAQQATGERPAILANQAHRFSIAEQALELGLSDLEILLEPFGRNTAPAAVIAALHAEQSLTDGDPAVLLMPSDQLIPDGDAFAAAVTTAAEAAAEGAIVTFGVEPHAPETGYGYIQPGGAIGVDGVRSVERFVEKPDAATAEAYLESGDFVWNAGIFVYRASAFLAEAERLIPKTLAACREALAKALRDLDFKRIDPAAFAACEDISIDYAIMEQTAAAAVLLVSFPWSDLGSWDAVWKRGAHDEAGNSTRGDVALLDCSGSLFHGSRRLIAGIGLKDIVVVDADDAILVLDRRKSQDVKQLVARLKRSNKPEATTPHRVHRPWGWYQPIDVGARHQVKILTIKPQARLSLQSHHHRAEHWVLVKGTVRVTIDDTEQVLTENESVYVPLGAKHRLENPGKIPAQIIEVQTGSYLGEDDIVRYEDVYGRLPEGSGDTP